MRKLLSKTGLSLKASMMIGVVSALSLLTFDAVCKASGESGSPQQRRRNQQSTGRIYKASIIPHWFADNTHFWYRNDLRGGERQFVVVDVRKGMRRPAFDHERLAQALKNAGLADVRADSLPLANLKFELEDNALVFSTGSDYWRCPLDSYELRKLAGRQDDGGLPAVSAQDIPRRSTSTGPETAITFVNRTSGEVELFWLDTAGRRHSYGKLPAGGERDQHTYAGHVWQAVDGDGEILAMFQAEDSPTVAEITGEKMKIQRDGDERTRRRPKPRDESPDGKFTAFVRDDNVYVRSKSDDTEIRLSEDGSPSDSYGMLEWAPDSNTLVAFRIEPGDSKEVYLIESSPEGGGRAKLHSRPYALPGDKFASYELNLFDVANKKQTRPDVERIDFGRPRLRWNRDSVHFTYEKTDRGHQRFRLVEVDSHTGRVRNIIDEKTDTFIWTAHTENVSIARMNWIPETNEIIYASERDGWRHLYLVDTLSGQIKRQITKGPYVVRGVNLIDEENRQIWFTASGRNPGQDPYLIHYYRVNFDGSGLVALTEGNGNHSVRYSPDRKYIIDTYSRVDMAPVHELRRTSEGKLICRLEEADISEIEEHGWEAPEVFAAKGRDGETDIWGIICRPHSFDPSRKYPIIEDIYAGPQDSYVPKTFSSLHRYESLTDLGFIVVKIDGMGTANRSKAFHDVCWKNLKDAGLPDRIAWIKAAAKKYPYMDISRVGVYGTSAGGQNAAGAVLFHPEFYKAAVASCGCHDNRMDKASWNEQWMGYPVGPQYAECSNIDNAYRLRGNLMLIVGEMDHNVPPESTMRFADALIKADKDFELVVIPGADHGSGGSYGRRRMQDFFMRHLQGAILPNHNAEAN